MAVTENQLKTSRNEGSLVGVPVKGSVNIYEGTIVFYDAASGYATDITNSGANEFAGVAKHQADNSGGSDGDITVELYQDGEFELVGSGFTQAAAGDLIYASDNYTATTTNTSNSLLGRAVEFVSTTKLLVKLDVNG